MIRIAGSRQSLSATVIASVYHTLLVRTQSTTHVGLTAAIPATSILLKQKGVMTEIKEKICGKRDVFILERFSSSAPRLAVARWPSPPTGFAFYLPASTTISPSSSIATTDSFGTSSSASSHSPLPPPAPRPAQKITLTPGSWSWGVWWQHSPFGLYRMHRPDGSIQGYRVDVLENVRITDDEVYFRDLILDAWIQPIAECPGQFNVQLLDEEEVVEAKRNNELTEQQARRIDRARMLLTSYTYVQRLIARVDAAIDQVTLDPSGLPEELHM
jgi:hypothetical protein